MRKLNNIGVLVIAILFGGGVLLSSPVARRTSVTSPLSGPPPISVFCPDVVTVRGRVMRPLFGGFVGVYGAELRLASGSLTRTARSSAFGYYEIENVPACGLYSMTATDKRYVFADTSFLLPVPDDASGVFVADFIAE
mgnify:CR=1 FL=1